MLHHQRQYQRQHLLSCDSYRVRARRAAAAAAATRATAVCRQVLISLGTVFVEHFTNFRTSLGIRGSGTSPRVGRFLAADTLFGKIIQRILVEASVQHGRYIELITHIVGAV